MRVIGSPEQVKFPAEMAKQPQDGKNGWAERAVKNRTSRTQKPQSA